MKYMIPNGKTDLKSLPEAVIERAKHEIATNKVEAVFCKIFGEILELDEVGATENFFKLGRTLLAELFTEKDSHEASDIDQIKSYDYSKINSLLKANSV